MIVTQSSPDFEGCYTCEANNSEGHVKTSGNLSVKSLYADCNCFTREHVSDAEELSEKVPVEIKKENVENYYEMQEELGR